MPEIKLSEYKNTLDIKHKVLRVLWNVVWTVFAKPFPRNVAKKWKLMQLRLFGAKIHKTANVYSSVRIYAPWNLEMHEFSCLAPEVDCYNVDKIIIGANTTISQKSYLCSASHDITKINNPLITAPIIIKDQVWVGADVFIGMGVIIEQGAVVGATSSVYKDVEAWTVVGGNPAKFIKKRVLDND